MNIIKENIVINGILEKLGYFIRPFFDNGSSLTQLERQFDNDLQHKWLKIKK